jgi:hypothetical protein
MWPARLGSGIVPRDELHRAPLLGASRTSVASGTTTKTTSSSTRSCPCSWSATAWAGTRPGRIASALAVRVIHEEIKREIDLLQDYVAAKTGVDRVTKRDITNMLEFAVNRASARVHAEALRDPSKRGMGTTLVLCAHPGPAGLHHLLRRQPGLPARDGVLEQVTEDHTVYNELIRRKKLPRERIEEIAPKNAITRAVGVFDHAEPESLVIDLVSGESLSCSARTV